MSVEAVKDYIRDKKARDFENIKALVLENKDLKKKIEQLELYNG